MAKNKSLAKVIDEIAVLIQKFVRLETADSEGFCKCPCGKTYHWLEMQGGHWIPRGKTATKIQRWNINAQCVSCNQYHKEMGKIYYDQWMHKKYGQEFVDAAILRAWKTVKYKRSELDEIKTFYKGEIKALEREIC